MNGGMDKKSDSRKIEPELLGVKEKIIIKKINKNQFTNLTVKLLKKK